MHFGIYCTAYLEGNDSEIDWDEDELVAVVNGFRRLRELFGLLPDRGSQTVKVRIGSVEAHLSNYVNKMHK